ncbi:MAG: ABC transporter substrate-binding protein [Ignavibacteria bacterium]
MSKLILTFLLLLSAGTNAFSQGKIGIAIPLMKSSDNSEDKKLGEQMLRGIMDALEEYNSSGPLMKITLVIEDTKRDQAATLQIINKFGSDSSVMAIFGPVFSSELINNAGAAAFHKIPVITPTATQNFLAEKNEYLFQLNPTYDIRGRLMARYAMNELGMKNFAILSEDTYGKNFEESFSDEVINSGNKILFVKYYSKDESDLSDELKELKTKIFEDEKFLDFGNMKDADQEKLKKAKLKFSYVDSLVNEKLVVSIYKLFGDRADRIIDSLGISPATNITGSRSYIPGITDAIYIPVSGSTEISNIIPQYFSENLNLPVLGTSDWNNLKTLTENKMYIKQLYFETDFYLNDKSGNDLINLSEADIKNYYFGYDGMKLILLQISDGNNTRQKLNDALQNVKDYHGIHNNVTMKDRTNHEMSVMSFKNGRIEKIKDFVY